MSKKLTLLYFYESIKNKTNDSHQFSAGVCLSLEVRQFPDVIRKPGYRVQISCSHNKTDYRVMLWYQRLPGDTAMRLIGYLYYNDATMEDPYKQDFNISGDLRVNEKKESSLVVNTAGEGHTAVYYCAAREAHRQKNPSELHKNSATSLNGGFEIDTD